MTGQAPITNLLTMPLVTMTVNTATNEDWIDSFVYLVGGTDYLTRPQLDLRGIQFDMEVRRQATDAEVLIRASTKDGNGLFVGEAPNYGFLLIQIPHTEMLLQHAGSYVADIIGTDQFNVRRCVDMVLNVLDGITRP